MAVKTLCYKRASELHFLNENGAGLLACHSKKKYAASHCVLFLERERGISTAFSFFNTLLD